MTKIQIDKSFVTRLYEITEIYYSHFHVKCWVFDKLWLYPIDRKTAIKMDCAVMNYFENWIVAKAFWLSNHLVNWAVSCLMAVGWRFLMHMNSEGWEEQSDQGHHFPHSTFKKWILFFLKFIEVWPQWVRAKWINLLWLYLNKYRKKNQVHYLYSWLSLSRPLLSRSYHLCRTDF